MSSLRIIVLAIALSASTNRAMAGFIIDDWFLSAHVSDFSSGGDESAFFNTVENPFQDLHSVILGNSSSQASYDFAWSPEAGLGTFDTDASHQAEDVGGSGLFSSSSGRIWISTDQDIEIDILGSYIYNTPATYFVSTFSVIVARDEPYERLFLGGGSGGPFDGDPPTGTFTAEGNVFLPAGDTYYLRYSMSIDSFGGGTGVIGTGSGNLSFTITPEPATLSLLALAAAPLLPRRRRRW